MQPAGGAVLRSTSCFHEYLTVTSLFTSDREQAGSFYKPQGRGLDLYMMFKKNDE